MNIYNDFILIHKMSGSVVDIIQFDHGMKDIFFRIFLLRVGIWRPKCLPFMILSNLLV